MTPQERRLLLALARYLIANRANDTSGVFVHALHDELLAASAELTAAWSAIDEA